MHAIWQLLAGLISSTSWRSAYIVDDTNQTIQYSPPSRWLGVACDGCYNGTETYNPFGCNTTDNCHLGIPFTGSGITLVMTLLYTTNFTVSIDGSAPVRFQFLQPLEGAMSFNFTAYDQQSLQFGDHNLDLLLLDANETADAAHNSNFLFDYALINDSGVPVQSSTSHSPTPSTSNTPGPSTSPSPSPSSPPNSTTAGGGSSGGSGGAVSVEPSSNPTSSTSTIPSPITPSNPTVSKSSSKWKTAVTIAVPVTVVIILALLCCYLSWRKRWFGLNGGRRGVSPAKHANDPLSYVVQPLTYNSALVGQRAAPHEDVGFKHEDRPGEHAGFTLEQTQRPNHVAPTQIDTSNSSALQKAAISLPSWTDSALPAPANSSLSLLPRSSASGVTSASTAAPQMILAFSPSSVSPRGITGQSTTASWHERESGPEMISQRLPLQSQHPAPLHSQSDLPTIPPVGDASLRVSTSETSHPIPADPVAEELSGLSQRDIDRIAESVALRLRNPVGVQDSSDEPPPSYEH